MLKNLKSLFIVADEGETVPGKSDAAAPQKSAASAQNPPRATSTGQTPALSTHRTSAPLPTTPLRKTIDVGPGTVNESIVAKLLDAIDNNDLEGFDYLEYKRALKAMDPLPMDEATKFRSAYATASTVGASLEKLLGSVTHYLSVLDRQRGDFEDVVQRELNAKVAGRESELATMQREIDNKSTEIARLQAEIDRMRGGMGELTSAVEESRAKILTTKAEFAASFDFVKSLFERDAEKMKQYLK